MWRWPSYKKPSFDPFTDADAEAEDGESGGGQGAVQFREALPRIADEFARARRYERPLTVAVLSIPAEAAGWLSTSGTEQRIRVLASVARRAMREIDLVCCDRQAGRCVIVMPEVGFDEAHKAVSRLQRAWVERFGFPLRAGIAVYPRDAWTFLDLADAADRHAALPGSAIGNGGSIEVN